MGTSGWMLSDEWYVSHVVFGDDYSKFVGLQIIIAGT